MADKHPPADVQARLDRLDEVLFTPGSKRGRVFMNPLTYADVRFWWGQKADPPYYRIDIESRSALLKMGLVAVLVTHGPEADPRQLWCSRLVPEGHVYITEDGFGPLKEAPSEDQLTSLEGSP